MKTQRKNFGGANAGGLVAPRQSEGGSAAIVFIALLAIMVILATVNAKALFRLHREVKLLEHQQIKRLNALPTNAAVVIQPASK